eukprot:6193362-Pleurochrysis_carterae.AAC.1
MHDLQILSICVHDAGAETGHVHSCPIMLTGVEAVMPVRQQCPPKKHGRKEPEQFSFFRITHLCLRIVNCCPAPLPLPSRAR